MFVGGSLVTNMNATVRKSELLLYSWGLSCNKPVWWPGWHQALQLQVLAHQVTVGAQWNPCRGLQDEVLAMDWQQMVARHLPQLMLNWAQGRSSHKAQIIFPPFFASSHSHKPHSFQTPNSHNSYLPLLQHHGMHGLPVFTTAHPPACGLGGKSDHFPR